MCLSPARGEVQHATMVARTIISMNDVFSFMGANFNTWPHAGQDKKGLAGNPRLLFSGQGAPVDLIKGPEVCKII